MRQFGGVDCIGVEDFYASFVRYVYEVLAGLVKELGVYVFLFGVVVPVPDFDSVAGCVGNYRFAVKGRVVAEEDGVVGVESGDLEFVDLGDFEEGFADFGFCC